MKVVIGIGELSVVVVCLFIQQIVSLPLTTTLKSTAISESSFNGSNNINVYNATTTTSSTNNDSILPPLIFPEDNTTYPIATNITAVKILTIGSNKAQEATTKNPGQKSEENYDSYYDDDDDSDVDGDIEPKKQIEDVQDNHIKIGQPELEEIFGETKNLFDVSDTTVVDITELKHGHWIAIFGGFLVLATACVYVGLLIWRNTIEKRYGMRERLVPESDSVYCSRNSMSQFEAPSKYR